MSSHPICAVQGCPNFDQAATRSDIICPKCRNDISAIKFVNIRATGIVLPCSEKSCSQFDPDAADGIFCTRHQAIADEAKLREAIVYHKGGAQRSTDADEHRFDLIPQRMLERAARVMHRGQTKYGAHNWEKGFSWSSIINHLLRHAFLYLIGDRTEDHLAHMVCNLGFLIEYETTHPEMNDIPSRGGSCPDESR